ncbi:hypothetical protein ACLB1M_19030 [Escherichia coli]
MGLKNSAASGKVKSPLLTIARTQRPMQKSSLALIGTGTLFNDSCSLNISGSDEEQARRVLEEYIRCALSTATASSLRRQN